MSLFVDPVVVIMLLLLIVDIFVVAVFDVFVLFLKFFCCNLNVKSDLAS